MDKKNRLILAPRQDVHPADPAHVRGVKQGNHPSKRQQATSGVELYDNCGFASPRRSTGIASDDRYPIHPDSPVLTPP